MTGETNSIKKTTLDKCLKAKHDLEAEGRQLTEQDRHEIPSPALLSGTRVLEGEGLFICCVVGDSSCVGKIRAALEQEDNECSKKGVN
jgi:magnesium-transporting ATPase (P-type)